MPLAKPPSARRVRTLISQCRTNLRHMQRSELVSARDFRAAKLQFEAALCEVEPALSKSSDSTLIIRDFIFPTLMTRLGLGPDVPLALKKQVLEVDQYDPKSKSQFLEKCDIRLEKSAMANRQSAIAWRIEQWLNWVSVNGWYPFFVTLTLDQAKVCREYQRRFLGPYLPGVEGHRHMVGNFWKDPANLKRVLDALERTARQSAKDQDYEAGPRDYSKRNCKRDELMQYIGVIEHGKSGCHHHTHLIVAMRFVPSAVHRDPNAGRLDANQRSCGWLKSIVGDAHGFGDVDVQYARYFGDVWSKLGHVWPCGARDLPPELGGGKQAIKIGPPGALAGYLSKYLGKDEKAWTHRIRASRGLGLQFVVEELAKLRDSQLEALTWRPRRYSTALAHGIAHAVPTQLLRDAASAMLFARRWNRGEAMVGELVDKLQIYRELSKVEADWDPSRATSADFYNFITSLQPAPADYSSDRLRRVHQRIAKRFQPVHYQEVRVTSQRRRLVDAARQDNAGAFQAVGSPYTASRAF